MIQVRSDRVDLERQSARKFLHDLQSFLSALNFFRSPLEVDNALQEFASNYCDSASRQSCYCHFFFNNFNKDSGLSDDL